MNNRTFDAETKIWSGPKVPPMFNCEQGLGGLILSVLALEPSRVAQISADTGARLTCGEIRERTLKIASHLSNLGLKQGDVVAIIAANGENIAPLVFACLLLGAPVCPIAPIILESDIQKILKKISPKLLFCDGSKVEVFESVLCDIQSDAKVYTVGDENQGVNSLVKLLEEATELLMYPEVDPNSTAFILFSSGTLSAPKGICKSHKELIFSFRPFLEVDYSGNFALMQSPISWITGVFLLILGSLYRLTRVITSKPYDPKTFVEILEKYKISWCITPPFTIVNLMESGCMKQLEHMRLWMIGGSTVSKKLLEDIQSFLPNAIAAIGYGSTEASIVSVNTTQRKIGSCGQIGPNLKMKIVDDKGNALDNHQQGELYIKGIVQFNGYYNESEITRAAFEDGWFKSDDIGYFDDEGFLHFVERKKDMMQYEGQKISPSELEIIINGIPGVVTSCVVGVLDPATKNDVIHAFVIAKSSSGLTEEFVESFVDGKVSERQKLRGGVHFVDNFPLGVSGKIIRSEMAVKAEKIIKK